MFVAFELQLNKGKLNQVEFDGVRIEMPTYLNALEVIKRFNELKSFIAD